MRDSIKNYNSDLGDQLVGDGLHVKLTSNRNILSIIGDGCRVNLVTNTGLLRITGDGCCVKINRNLGSIEYCGDGGRIILGPESLDREKIKYTGEGGVVEINQISKCKDGYLQDEENIKTTKKSNGKKDKKTTLKTSKTIKIRNDDRITKGPTKECQSRSKSAIFINSCN